MGKNRILKYIFAYNTEIKETMATLAYLIGNSKYTYLTQLENPENDAKELAEKLNSLGITTKTFYNQCGSEYAKILSTLEKDIKDYDDIIFYYAGHAFQIKDENYLAGIDLLNVTSLPDEREKNFLLKRASLLLSEVLEIFKEDKQTKVHIVILDACRIYPTNVRGGESLSIAPLMAPKGTMIAYSTSPNEPAIDTGFPNHSVYTGALLQFIEEKIPVETLFKKVRATVFYQTKGKQTTWEHSCLIGDFYFNKGISSCLNQSKSHKELYESWALKDENYDYENISTPIAQILNLLHSQNFNKQNTIPDRLNDINIADIDKNLLFLLGRNLLQCSENSFKVSNWFSSLYKNLKKYSQNGMNHVLNGILYEIYFNSHGEFRQKEIKRFCLDSVWGLIGQQSLSSSFQFIQERLIPYKGRLSYIPGEQTDNIEVHIIGNILRGKTEIEAIRYNGKDIKEDISTRYGKEGKSENLINILSDYLVAPSYIIQLSPAISTEVYTIIQPQVSVDDNHWNIRLNLYS